MSEITDERYAFGSTLRVEDPAVGKFFTKGLYTGLELTEKKNNWLVGPYGSIDKIGIRNGHLDVYRFEGLTFGPNPNWQLQRLELPGPSSFAYGLGVTIHVDYPEITGSTTSQPPTQFLFTSIGLEFVKST